MTAKDTIRQRVIKERGSLSKDYVKKTSQKILLNLQSLGVWRTKQTVHIYLPINGKNEVDTWPSLQWLLKEGHEVWASYLPADESQDGFCMVNETTDYKTGRYNIPLPQEEIMPAVEPTVVVIPCLAADKEGNRLGYGSGWYDWFLGTHPKAQRIGVVNDKFLFDEVPRSPQDETLDVIVTNKEIIHTTRI